MPVPLPELLWPSELVEQGPPEDPSILLSAAAEVGGVRHRILAVRVNPHALSIDYRAGVDDDSYAASQLDERFEGLTFLEDISTSNLVQMAGASYLIWMMPFDDSRNGT
jgi:hypothetical protein